MKALSKVTRSIKPAEVEKKWHVIDADGLIVGRLDRPGDLAERLHGQPFLIFRSKPLHSRISIRQAG